MTLQTILFDFDGVLLDSAADIAAAVNATLSNFGYSTIAEGKIKSFIGNGAPKLIERSLQESVSGQIDEQLVSQILPWYIDYYSKHCAVYSTLYAGVPDLLAELDSRGVKMGLVSNKPLGLSRLILAHFGLEHFFGSIVGPESTAKLKPAPDGLVMALHELNASPATALMVGDAATDIQAAKAAGIYSCAVTGGLGNVEALLAENADMVVELARELLEKI